MQNDVTLFALIDQRIIMKRFFLNLVLYPNHMGWVLSVRRSGRPPGGVDVRQGKWMSVRRSRRPSVCYLFEAVGLAPHSLIRLNTGKKLSKNILKELDQIFAT